MLDLLEKTKIAKANLSEFKALASEFNIDTDNFDTLIRYKKGSYIVYIDKQMDFDWATSDEYDNIAHNDCTYSKLISEIEFIQHRPISILLTKDLKKHLSCMLAEVLTYIFDNDYEVAQNHLNKINIFLDERNYEITRKWHILFSSIATILIFAIIGLVNFYSNQITDFFIIHTEILFYINFMPFGALGATISIFQGAKKKEYNCESGIFLNLIEIFVRIATGIVSSGLAICLYNTDIIFTVFKASKNSTAALIIICFVVGFSERWIPSIVNKFENSELKGD